MLLQCKHLCLNLGWQTGLACCTAQDIRGGDLYACTQILSPQKTWVMFALDLPGTYRRDGYPCKVDCLKENVTEYSNGRQKTARTFKLQADVLMCFIAFLSRSTSSPVTKRSVLLTRSAGTVGPAVTGCSSLLRDSGDAVA